MVPLVPNVPVVPWLLLMKESLIKTTNDVELTMHQIVITNVSSTRQRRHGRTSYKTIWVRDQADCQAVIGSLPRARQIRSAAKSASTLDKHVRTVRRRPFPSSRIETGAVYKYLLHYFDITKRGATIFRSRLAIARRRADPDVSWLGNESRHKADWSFLVIDQMDLLETATAGTNDSVTVRTWLRDAFARRWELEMLRLLKSNPFLTFFLEIMIKNTDSSTPEIIRHKTAPRASRKSLTCVALTDCESHERLSDEQRFQSWLECHASQDSDAATNWYFQKTILDCSVSSLSSTSSLDCEISSTTTNYK